MLKATLIAAVLIGFAVDCATAQQASTVFGVNVDHANANWDHAKWPAPEAVANDLRSANEETRVKALELIGFTDEQVHRPVWSQGTPTQSIGTKAVTPDEIRLTYAAIGDSETKQAILAVYVEEMQTAQLAVAVPVAGGWERIASLGCWCKYEMNNGDDALSAFMQLQSAPGTTPSAPRTFELVVRASGGGSGLYDQTEARFRIFREELRQVISFTSRYRNCDGTASPPICTGERRWFYPTQLADGPGGVLVRNFGEFPADGQTSIFWSVRDLEIRKLQRVQCTRFRWDSQRFSYQQVTSATNSCATALP